MFSLTNKDNQPCKILQNDYGCSINCEYFNGPIFDGGYDIFVCDSADDTEGSFSHLGTSYEHPHSGEDHSYLAGSADFLLSEIEVYQKD